MLFVLKLCFIHVVISLPLWIKLSLGQLLLFFLCNFSSFFIYVGGIPVTNHFSLFLIDRYILAIRQIIINKEHFRYSFWSKAIFWTSLEALAPWPRQQKVVKTASKSFHWAVPSKSRHFLLFDVCSIRPPQIFQVQATTSTVRPVFPDYLSVTYDYDKITWTKYKKNIKNLWYLA